MEIMDTSNETAIHPVDNNKRADKSLCCGRDNAEPI